MILIRHCRLLLEANGTQKRSSNTLYLGPTIRLLISRLPSLPRKSPGVVEVEVNVKDQDGWTLLQAGSLEW